MGGGSAPLFPAKKIEGWWVVIGNASNNSLLSIKRVNLVKSQKVKLQFLAPEEAGDYNLKLYLISDSYMGCDQEFDLPLSVAAGDDEDDDDDDEEDE